MKVDVQTNTVTLEFTVTPDMAASLDGKVIHPLYSTYWLAYHAEVAARKVIEPYFDEGENAIGAALTLEHIAMCPVGVRVQITAYISEINNNRIICAFTAKSGDLLIAQGTQTQIVLPQYVIDQRISSIYNRYGIPLLQKP